MGGVECGTGGAGAEECSGSNSSRGRAPGDAIRTRPPVRTRLPVLGELSRDARDDPARPRSANLECEPALQCSAKLTPPLGKLSFAGGCTGSARRTPPRVHGATRRTARAASWVQLCPISPRRPRHLTVSDKTFFEIIRVRRLARGVVSILRARSFLFVRTLQIGICSPRVAEPSMKVSILRRIRMRNPP